MADQTLNCTLEDNKKRCPCPSDGCNLKGACCQCLAKHLAGKTLSACCFPPGKSKEFGRSFEGFARAWGIIS